MRVLSLFDGISCGRIALERAGIYVEKYYSSEIDKYANAISQNNYQEIIRLGDIENWNSWDIEWDKIDLIIGGSPCQGFSFAGKQLAFDDPRSKLFFTYVQIIQHTQRHNHKVKFLLENVKMKSEYLDIIDYMLGVPRVFINSALVSAQNRQRYYWANWEITQPEDLNIELSSILEFDLPEDSVGAAIRGRYLKSNEGAVLKTTAQFLETRSDKKANCLTTVGKDSVLSYVKTDVKLKIKKNQNKAGCLTAGAHSAGHHSDMDILIIEPDICRRYSVIECERLQTLPDGYTDCVSTSQRYKAIGNGWTVDVIAHIFDCLMDN